jgi:DNA-binding XRE family transcriptional regulator
MNLKEIKDAARQAFRDQQTQDTEGGVPDGVSFCAGFLAGVRHRQSEIDELTSVLDLKKETLVELEEENKKLRDALKLTIKTAEYVYQPNKPLEKGLPPFHYHTLTYEGDLELIEKTKEARKLLDSIKE